MGLLRKRPALLEKSRKGTEIHFRSWREKPRKGSSRERRSLESLRERRG